MHEVARALAAAALTILGGAAFAAQAPFAALKAVMKEGRYETRAVTDMTGVPGAPPGLAPLVTTARQCLTARSIENGGFTRGRKATDELCRIEGLKVGAGAASYFMRCADLESEVTMTFREDGYSMDIRNTSMEGPKGTQRYVTTQKLEARYLGPGCGKD